MRLSAKGAQKTRNESKKLQMYSKQWLPGDTLRVFYPIYWEDGKPEIAVGALWGHSVSDIKGLGLRTAFIPSTTQFDENALPIGQPDITYQFSQIARIFVNGAKAKEEAAVMNKNWPNENLRKEALKNVENKYDSKNNRNAVRPIIGKPQFYISTEVISVKIVNDVPNDETIAVTSAPLSDKTIRLLYQLMEDPKYGPKEGDEFFEVEWHYVADPDKAESARNTSPSGLTAEYKSENKYPDMYKKVQGRFDTVATDSDSITRRATTAVDPNKVRSHLQQWAFLNSEDLDCIEDEDKETLLKHIDLIQELDLTRALSNPDLIETVKAELAAWNEKQRVESGAPHVSPDVQPTVSIPTPVDTAPAATPDLGGDIPSLLDSVPGVPSINSLLNSPNLASETSLDLESIDLGQTV